MDENVVRLSISMYPRDQALLSEVAKSLGTDNLSAALRYVLADWQRMRAMFNRMPMVPWVAAGEPEKANAK